MDAQPLRAGGGIDEIIDRCQKTVYGLALAKTGSPAGYEPIPEPIAQEPVSGDDDLARHDILDLPADKRDADVPAYDPQA